MPNKWEKKRFEFLDKVDNLFMSKLGALQKALYEELRDYFEAELTIRDNKIITATTNYQKINRMNLVTDDFRKTKTKTFLQWIAGKFIDLIRLNKNYFSTEDDSYISADVHERVRREMLSQIGINVRKDKAYISQGGWLDQLGSHQAQYLRVKEMAINAVATGMPWREFKTLLKEEIEGPGSETLRHHFYTHAYDSFTAFDRMTALNYAIKLGMGAFRYSGGLIKTSREFCKDRDGKIFTIEEAKQWIDLEWQGKSTPYFPLRDMGGYNCRHTMNFIPNRKAIKERPELKDVL